MSRARWILTGLWLGLSLTACGDDGAAVDDPEPDGEIGRTDAGDMDADAPIREDAPVEDVTADSDRGDIEAGDADAPPLLIGPSGGSVVSDDGLLELVVPDGALASDTAISATRESDATWPTPVADWLDGALAEAFVYDLLPEGTRFAEPVDATLSVATGFTRDGDRIAIDGSDLISYDAASDIEVRATTTWASEDGTRLATQVDHFSRLFQSANRVSLSIDAVGRSDVGDCWNPMAAVFLRNEAEQLREHGHAGNRGGPNRVEEVQVAAFDALQLSGGDSVFSANPGSDLVAGVPWADTDLSDVCCVSAGEGRYWVVATVDQKTLALEVSTVCDAPPPSEITEGAFDSIDAPAGLELLPARWSGLTGNQEYLYVAGDRGFALYGLRTHDQVAAELAVASQPVYGGVSLAHAFADDGVQAIGTFGSQGFCPTSFLRATDSFSTCTPISGVVTDAQLGAVPSDGGGPPGVLVVRNDLNTLRWVPWNPSGYFDTVDDDLTADLSGWVPITGEQLVSAFPIEADGNWYAITEGEPGHLVHIDDPSDDSTWSVLGETGSGASRLAGLADGDLTRLFVTADGAATSQVFDVTLGAATARSVGTAAYAVDVVDVRGFAPGEGDAAAMVACVGQTDDSLACYQIDDDGVREIDSSTLPTDCDVGGVRIVAQSAAEVCVAVACSGLDFVGVDCAAVSVSEGELTWSLTIDGPL